MKQKQTSYKKGAEKANDMIHGKVFGTIKSKTTIQAVEKQKKIHNN